MQTAIGRTTGIPFEQVAPHFKSYLLYSESLILDLNYTRPTDRLLWCFIAKFWAGWRTAVYFVQPRTVTTWQKKRFRDYWRALSQSTNAGRPRISPELRKLIGRMWEANPTWGSPKIVAELAMLGVYVAKSTVEKYKPKRTGSPSPKWRTFLDQPV